MKIIFYTLVFIALVCSCQHNTSKAQDFEKAYKHKKKGLTLLKSNQIQEGILELKKAIEFFPDYDTAYYNIGVAYSNLYDFENSEKYMRKAIEINDQSPDYFTGLGIVYLQQNKFDLAKTTLMKSLKLNPNNELSLSWLSMIYKESSKPDSSLIMISRAIEINPKSDYCYLNRAVLYNSIGEYSKALEDINYSIKLDSAFATDGKHYNRGLIYFNQGKKEEACKEWQLAVENGSQEAMQKMNEECQK